MMRSYRFLLVSLLATVALGLGVAPAAADQKARTDTKCREVNAVAAGQGQFNPDGSVDTTARITKDPLLKGTLAGHFVVTPGSSSVLPFAGDVTITTRKGTLTLAVTGALDTATGGFTTSEPVTAGTGHFAGATGHLTIMGNQDTTGAFTETIEGRICLSK